MYDPNKKYPNSSNDEQSKTDGKLESKNTIIECGTVDIPILVAGFEDRSIRHNFIRKVYSILFIQILITILIVSLSVFNLSLKTFLLKNYYIFWIACGIGLFIVCAYCYEDARRSYPLNMILLIIFTIAESIVVAYGAILYPPFALLMAFGITGLIVLGLTLFAFQTRFDFTGCGGFLCVILLVFFIFTIVLIFIPKTKTLLLVYASLGAILFSFYLVYDTQLMIGGDHKFSIGPEEYIVAAISLYMDIVLIFRYLLAIIGLTSNN